MTVTNPKIRNRTTGHAYRTSGEHHENHLNTATLSNGGNSVILNLREGHRIDANVQVLNDGCFGWRPYNDEGLLEEHNSVVVVVETKDGKQEAAAIPYNDGGREVLDRLSHVAHTLARSDLTLVQTDNPDDITKASLSDIIDGFDASESEHRHHTAYVKQDVPNNYHVKVNVVEYETKSFAKREDSVKNKLFDETTS